MPWKPWMSAVAGLCAGALTLVAVPSSALFVADGHRGPETATGERWACAMMDYIGTRPGTCPVCGMKLERVTAGELTREQQRRMGVQVVKAEEGPATQVVRASGITQWDDRFSKVVIARVPGRIVKRHAATFGCCQDVEAGEPVVDLYSPMVFAAQGELAAAIRSGDERLVRALEERFARWNLTPVAEAITAGKPPVDTVTITTPWAGQVWLEDAAMVDRTLMVGAEVAEDMPLIRLVDAQRLTVVLQVDERQARMLRVDQAVELASDDGGELTDVRARIGRVGNEIDPALRTREVRLWLEDGRRRLQPGSLVEARIRAALGPDLGPADPADPASWGRFVTVPKTAVLSTGVRHVAWRRTGRNADGTATFELVTLALGPRLESPTGDDRVIVRAGLKAGDEVATRGAFLIDSQAQLAGSASLLFPAGAVQAADPHAGH